MLTRQNRYLKDRAMDRERGRDGRRGVAGTGRGRDREGMRHIGDNAMRDGRNPYGSRGGYVNSRRDSRMNDMRGYDRYENGSGYNYADNVYQHEFPDNTPYDYESDYGEYDSRYDDRRGDYRRGRQRDYRSMDYDYADYADMEDEYKEELEKWSKKLKKFDRFGLSKEEILKQAKQMGVEFKDFDEDEFVAVYYMIMSDFKDLSNSPQQYLVLAKQWLEDDDVEMQGSEKLCAYLYGIVLGEEK